jgi:hypothetical protein
MAGTIDDVIDIAVPLAELLKGLMRPRSWEICSAAADPAEARAS